MRRLLLLLLLATALGQITEPKLVGRLSTSVTQSGSIYADGTIYSLDINVSMPQEAGYQEVSASGSFITDSEGNRLISVSESNPKNPYGYSFVSSVDTRERLTTTLPMAYSVPDEFMRYAAASETVQSDHPVVRQLAQQITANASSDFEKVARLASWVNAYMTYDISLVGERKDALWVLQNRRGVCVEYSSLFAALARSLGYPTRFVLGQAYGDYGWLGHAWNEVYIGEWVPVDATWLEAGHLDATHIEFFKSVESEASNRVVARVSDEASIRWQKPEFAGESTGTAVEIGGIEIADDRADYSLEAVAPAIGFGGQTLVTFAISSDDYRLVDLKLVPCRSDETLLTIDEPTKAVVLEPGETTYAAWIVTAAEGLDPSIAYTCPVTLNSRYLTEKSASIGIAASAVQNGFSAFVSDTQLPLGEKASVFAHSSPGEALTVYGDGYLESRLASSGTTEFSFAPAHAGPLQVLVAAGSGGVAELQLDVSKSLDLYIGEVSLPARAFAGREWLVNVSAVNGMSRPESVSVTATLDGQERMARLSLDGTVRVNFTFTPATAGEKTLEISLSDGGSIDTKVVPVHVYAAPRVDISKPMVERRGDMAAVSFVVAASDSVQNATLHFAGNTAAASSGVVSFVVEPGLYELTASWSDIDGNSYSNRSMVNAVLPPKPFTSWISFPFVVVILAGSVIFFILYCFGRVVRAIRG